MALGRRFTPRQQNYRAPIIGLNLALHSVIDELFEIEDAKGGLPEKTPHTKRLDESLQKYLRRQKTNRRYRRKKHLFFTTKGEEDTLKDAYGKENYLEKTEGLYQKVAETLNPKTTKKKRLKNAKNLGDEILKIVRSGLGVVEMPPRDNIPLGVRALASELYKEKKKK